MNEDKYIPQQDERDTHPLSPDRGFQEAPQRLPHILDNQIPKAIRFMSADIQAVFTVDVESMMVIGRRSSIKDNDMEVSVDLSGFDAYKMGVSRYHAMILSLDNRMTIKDLNSLNGTRLNNLDLQPAREYLLEHGDTLSFGTLTFEIAFVY